MFIKTKTAREHDEYDALNPLYVILENSLGEHMGSMRFLPTTGRTMVNEHFLNLTGGVQIRSPLIWECTRFCVSKSANKRSALRLMAAGAYLMNEYCIEHFIGVFDEKMERVYNRIGAIPTILGKQSTEQGAIGVGLWEFDPQNFQALCQRAGYTKGELDWYFDGSELYVTPGPSISNPNDANSLPNLASLKTRKKSINETTSIPDQHPNCLPSSGEPLSQFCSVARSSVSGALAPPI